MNEKMKKFGKDTSDKWNSLSKGLKAGLIGGVCLIIAALIIVASINGVTKRNNNYIVLFKEMTSAETAEVVKILDANGTSTRMSPEGELMVPSEDWDKITLSLAAKGYPRSTPSYKTFLDDLSMTSTEWEKNKAYIIALEQKLADTLRIMDGINDATVTLNIAEKPDVVWDETKQKSTASVMIVRDTLTQFTNENVSAIKNLVAYSCHKMEPADVKVTDSTGKVLLSVDEMLAIEGIEGEEQRGGVPSSMTLEEQALQQTRQIALEKATARVLVDNAVNVLSKYFGAENVSASATVSLNYNNILREMTEYIPLMDKDGNLVNGGVGIPTDEHVEYIVDKDLRVNDGGIVGEDENTDIPTYQNGYEGLLTNSDGTYYKRDTFWAISQIVTQEEPAKGSVESASIAVSVIDKVNPIMSEDDQKKFSQLIANATNIPVEKVSFVHRYVPKTITPAPQPDKPTFAQLFNDFIWSIISWIAGFVFFLIVLIILLVMYGHRKTQREVRRAELESQAAIQSLQTTLDEHKRTLQDEVEAHQQQTNSTANEVREFVKENPEITAALIRSMLHRE